VQARERRSTGLDALPQIEQAFKRAAVEAPSLEEGGPDRALALLYLRAPGWPTGPGDPDLGLMHARKAVQLSPAYPPNQLALAEALKATGDAEESASTYQRALDLARSRAAARDPDASEWIEEAEKALKGETR
jgi:tetratricopeptide (TPR) repeat protein